MVFEIQRQCPASKDLNINANTLIGNEMHSSFKISTPLIDLNRKAVILRVGMVVTSASYLGIEPTFPFAAAARRRPHNRPHNLITTALNVKLAIHGTVG